ncbi:hypothetical protein [Streptomyces sp. MMG1533]|uniref:hypothetical protein n=1 Tax=Streptomyces sp. MMG1533 TaxID=1415546 RepID=UPI001F303897|nr:hypothetical protein [Streptomyces sp. MMG1533]
MGIRMLHRRAHARAQAKADADAAPPAPPPPPVPAFAAAASTARIPTDPAAALRRAAAMVPTGLVTTVRRATAAGTSRIPAGLATALHHAAAGTRRRLDRRDRGAVQRKREASVWRLWADLGRSSLALALTLLPRSRPMSAFPVFTVVSEWPIDAQPRPRPNRRGRGPDATP